MNSTHDNPEDRPLAALLAAIETDAAPPDRANLERLREDSARAFEARAEEAARQKRNRRMLRTVRVLASTIAAAVLLAFGVYLWQSTRSPRPTLGDALEKLVAARTLHYSLAFPDSGADVWVKRPGLVRWDTSLGEGPWKYVVARDGEEFWINPEENRVGKGMNTVVHCRENNLEVLDSIVEPQARASLLGNLHATPVAREKDAGRDCWVYRIRAPLSGPPPARREAEFEARVDIATGRLRSLSSTINLHEQGKRFCGMISLLSYDQEAPDELFQVSDTLTEDGRVGKVLDVQGIVTLKPKTHERWTPVSKQFVLKPGDWVRTDVRGANAVALQLVKHIDIILGPGSQLEVLKPTQVRLTHGELEINVPEKAELELLAPDGQRIQIRGKQRYRLDKHRLVAVSQEPLWLKGFKGTTTSEALGSLIAKVDGRDVPLTVGYHKVTVDIRDQIARTVIEESFVNHTDQVLEGVFHFPLPQDASISGFGMWVGDNLVEADVVEKQRAREIYETILYEKRDPGLLEWAGGNIFKARVYPIPGNAEKRIKITYTQVLPLRGNSYRYSYGLQSELLKQHPLRELAIDVKVHSATPLRSVKSPTHTTRSELTPHAAHLEFGAQEYVPDRDFEVVCEVARDQERLALIPHRRGDDGYLMLQLLPPNSADAPDRAVLPSGQPLNLLILADTSASMDAGQRSSQEAVIGTLLAALSPKDGFNLAACDVNCDWAFDQPRAAEPTSIAAARQFLAGRVSLGWTDLDHAFASAFKQASAATHVIYVGDGVVTAGDADPVAFTQRLKQLHQKQGTRCTGHAIGLGSSFESGVLKAIASLGGGSTRRVSNEQGPAAVALELLQEIVQPGWRDLRVEFKGIRTARVYPETLPNLPYGTQQIVLGRYLPEGTDQEAEVIVTGRRGDEPVRFSQKVTLKDAEQGNSFIPRLWARLHLDHLLEQGASEAIKDEIIALAEEFQIMTPYTSFLVLESDADRERFQVKRRFRMRDGEKFFAEGRDNANFELKQVQMKRAGEWRAGLRRRVLAQLSNLGRTLPATPGTTRMPVPMSAPAGAATSGFAAGVAGRLGRPRSDAEEFQAVDMDRGGRQLFLGDELRDAPTRESLDLFGRACDDRKALMRGEKEVGNEADTKDVAEAAGLAAAAEPEAPRPDVDGLAPQFLGRRAKLAMQDQDAESMDAGLRGTLAELPAMASESPAPNFGYGGWYDRRGFAQSQHQAWLDGWFLPLPAPPVARPRADRWPAEARALARSLLRTASLAGAQTGFSLDRETRHFDARGDETASSSRSRAVVTPKAWWLRTDGDSGQPQVEWFDGRERAVYGAAFQLGRRRAATEGDKAPPLELNDFSLTPLDVAFAAYRPMLERRGDGQVLLTLQEPAGSVESRFLIDTRRHVVLSQGTLHQGKRTSLRQFSNFAEVAGSWWARREELTDADGRRSSLTTQKVEQLSAEATQARWQQESAANDAVLFLRQPLPKVQAAKQADASGKATFEDEIVLLEHFARSQQWGRVNDHLRKCAALAGGKAGFRWLESAVLGMSRRHEELKKRLRDEAGQLLQMPASPEQAFLTRHVVAWAGTILEANEMLALLERVRPAYEELPARRQGMKDWKQLRASYLEQTGQAEAALRLRKEMAEAFPHDYALQQAYANALASSGEHAAAHAWIIRVVTPEAKWLPHEEAELRGTYTRLLENQGRYREMATYLADWVGRNPESVTPYAEHLSALIRSDQAPKAEALVGQWLRDGLSEKPSAAAVARLQAAVQLALGQGHSLHTGRLDPRWLKPLSEVARTYAVRDDHFHVAEVILGQHQFRHDDLAQPVFQGLADRLTKSDLPVPQLTRAVSWLQTYDPRQKVENWNAIIATVRRRYQAEESPESKHLVGNALGQLIQRQGGAAAMMAFLRMRLRDEGDLYRQFYARQLFDLLLGQAWVAEHEGEALALLSRLGDSGGTESHRRAAQVQALYQLTDRMVAARAAAALKKIEHPEKLTRVELAQKQVDALKHARAGWAEHLRAERGGVPAGLAAWLDVERLYLETLLGRDLPAVAAACWAYLGESPGEISTEDEEERKLQALLQNRHLQTLCYLATRKGAEPALVEWLLRYLDRGITAQPESAQWKVRKQQLLIALDRPKELEVALREWVRSGDAGRQWRIELGYLYAELGRIPEGIQMFEAVRTADELSPQDYRTLANWYLVARRPEAHDHAVVDAYKTMEEWRLQQLAQQKFQVWQSGSGQPRPSELEKDVLLIFAALFEKSAQPQQHVWLVQQYYQASRDFRLLTGLADAVVGHTAGKVYPFTQGMQSTLNEIQDEATVDALTEHLAKVRQRAKTPVDQRALDLLEAQVQRRAAELQNQAGPHGQAAVAALKRAFDRPRSPGEPRLLADFLAGLGQIAFKPLAEEQLRELMVLHQEEGQGTFDRLHIALQLANARQAYGQHQPAIDGLDAALREYQAASDGVLPNTANPALDTLVNFLEAGKLHARAEALLQGHLRHPFPQQQALWLRQRLYRLYIHAVNQGGTVSLGKGVALYDAVERRLQADLGTTDQNHRYALVTELLDLYRAAHAQKWQAGAADLRAFAFDKLPQVLKQQTTNYLNMIGAVAQTLHDLLGPRDGLAFLVDRAENSPSWARYTHERVWQQFGHTMGQWRAEIKDLGDVEERLLGLVLGELRRDLENQEQGSRVLYHQQSGHFWAERADAFAKVAEAVLASRHDSAPAALYIADYFFWGLGRRPRAIDILLDAEKRGLLDDGGRARLVQYLHHENRFAESVALLQGLVRRHADDLNYRVLLLRSYFRSGKHEDLAALLQQTDAYFHRQDRWHEGVIAALGSICVEAEHYAQAVAYYNELIPLHQRTQPGRGVGNGTLSQYYTQLALAYAGVGKTGEAVDAASAAVVSWGPHYQQRAAALSTLKQVLAQAKDLKGYVEELTKTSTATGQDNPLARKALGEVFLERNELAAAQEQLQLAHDLQPHDPEIAKLLIACCDRRGDRPGALRQLLELAQHARRDLQLYRDLGDRYAALQQPVEAERAYTSMVEMQPAEAESHALLADQREKQGRWDEAIREWEHVARLRALEPTGLLRLAAVQVHQKQWQPAEATLHKLRARAWPAQFNEALQRLKVLEAAVAAGQKSKP